MHNVYAVEKLSSHHPRVTKRITDIFRSTHKRILIEGAPGIGKTVLAKEIAYCWANGEILTDMKLFLLLIRDPDLHCVTSINKLAHYLGNHFLNDTEVAVVADEFKKTKGSNIVFVIDGYDECPCNRALKVFIDKLCHGNILSQCMVVITSRPTASLLLRQLVNQRIEILGLAKKEQDQYISESLKGSPEIKIKLLQEYLKQQPIISSLICVPLHLAVLLYLFKQNSLPETLTEMNELFVVHTIYRHLSKAQGGLSDKVRKLTDLPKIVYNVIKQLSKLAFEGLLKNQLVFTSDEIKKVCPEIDNIPGAINAFDLLQTVQHYCQRGGAGTDMSFVFVHFTMQEFLAAFYISTLQNDQQSLWITRTFWDSQLNFMWMMYVGIVGIKSECVTNLIHSFNLDWKYNHQHNIKGCLHLFQCYSEAKDIKLCEIPKVLSSIFIDGNINFYSMTSLLPNHVTSLTHYMMKSRVKWKSINLRACNICDDGMRILQQFFINFQDKATSIKSICLSGNNLTSFFGSETQEIQKLTETISVISTFYSFQLLELSNNHLSYNGIIELASVNVRKLDISHNNISDYEARAISECLKRNNTICELDISSNTLNNEGIIAISEAISVNRTLHKINIADNNIPDNGTEAISSCLISNKTLLELDMSKNLISKEGVMRIVKACTINRTLHKLVCTHNNLSESGLAAINEYIRKKNAVQIFDASWNSIGNKGNQLAIKIKFTQNLIDNTCEEVWLLSEISYKSNSHKDQLIHSCLKDDFTLGNLAVSRVYLLDIIINSVLLGVLESLDISCNNISDEGIKKVAEAIQINTTLQKLNISKNRISKEGVMRIVEVCTINRTLHKLVCTHNNLSKSGLAAINEYIRKENAVQIVDASWNDLGSKDGKLAIKTTFQSNNDKELWFIDETTEVNYRKEVLKVCCEDHWSEQTFNLSAMGISNFEVVIISDCLKLNSKFKELNLSNNIFNDEGVKAITKVIQINTSLQKLNVSCNKITDERIKTLAEAIQINTTLQELNISKNWISKEGVMRIVEACTINRTLHKLVCTYNNLSKSGLAAINEYIRKENAVQIFDASWNNLGSKDGKLAIETTFQLLYLDVQEKLPSDNDKTFVGQFSIECITQLKYRNEFLHCCFEEYWNVQSVNMSYMGISDSEVVVICDYINLNSEVNELNLSGNKITDVGLKEIVKAIQVNTKLQNIDLSHNLISDGGISSVGDIIKINSSTLCKLNLSSNTISNNGTKTFAEAIQVTTTLQDLDISQNTISDDGILAISNSLKVNDTLCKLNLSGNKMTNEGLEKLTEAIQVNTTLQKLDISHNTISNDGISSIGDCLKINSTLCKLSMSSNQITDEGAKKLAEAIKVNKTLQKLNVSKNWISKEGVMRIVEACTINRTLYKLVCTHNNLSESELVAIDEYIRKENAVQVFDASWNSIIGSSSYGSQLIITTFYLLTYYKYYDNYKEVWLVDDGVWSDIQYSFTYGSLIELTFPFCSITFNVQVDIIQRAMQVDTLQKLSISNNKISDDGAIAFSECLKTVNSVSYQLSTRLLPQRLVCELLAPCA